MVEARNEYFGSKSQQALQKRAELLWALVKDDPQFSCHGRAVSISGGELNDITLQASVARLIGASAAEGVLEKDKEDRKAALTSLGMITDEYSDWLSTDQTFDLAQQLVDTRPLAEDLTVIEVGSDTPLDDLKALDAFTQTCDVLLPMGSFIRGEARSAVCIFAEEPNGRIVGVSGSVDQFHPDHAKGGMCWWGMLATADHRRGEGIALILGAMALLAMRDRFGFQKFFTGIREGNIPSEKLCSKLGFAPSGQHVVLAIDPEVMQSTQVTK